MFDFLARRGTGRPKLRRSRRPNDNNQHRRPVGVPRRVNRGRGGASAGFVAVPALGVVLVCQSPQPPAEPLPLLAASAVSIALTWWHHREGGRAA
jgi:hypothetical protein